MIRLLILKMIKLLDMSLVLMRNGEHYSESQALMEEKLLMAEFNFISFKEEGSKCFKVMLVHLGKLIFTTKLINLKFSAMLKEKLEKRLQMSTSHKFLHHHKDSKNSKKLHQSYMTQKLLLTSLLP